MKTSLITNKTHNFNKNQSVSFKGIYNNKLLLNGLKFAAKNGTLFSATVSLGLSTVARPVAIMATPKTDKENRKLACAKSLSSSAVGYLVMLLASSPVARAVSKIDKAPEKFLKQATIKNLQNGAKTLSKSKSYSFATQLFKLGVGFVIAAPKSALTCVLIPPIMKLFGKDKKEQIQNKNSQKSKIISFKGLYNAATDKIAAGIGKLLDKKSVQDFAKKYYDTNYSQHIASLTDIVLTLSFAHQTAKSKKIEQSRKKTLIYNALISTGLCLTGGYAVNHALEKPAEKFIQNFKAANKNLPELEKYVEGIKIAKPVLILGIIYYIFIPVISTFFAERADFKKKNTLLSE